VQGVLAPLQFLVFLVSLFLVLRYLPPASASWPPRCPSSIKTLILYTIMITGSIWEKVVFGKYLFAKAFFWEDVFSMLVLALHTAYLGALLTGFLDVRGQMLLALAAYATYVINATQFLLKLRAARLSAGCRGRGRRRSRRAGEAFILASEWFATALALPRPTPSSTARRNAAACDELPVLRERGQRRSSAGWPASSGCIARSRMPSSWSWVRAPVRTCCSPPRA
jgi:3-vinyl bacteriochlorophyllide hydratase